MQLSYYGSKVLLTLKTFLNWTQTFSHSLINFVLKKTVN